MCADLGHADETVTRTDLAGLAAGAFPPLAVVVLEAPAAPAGAATLAWGRPDGLYGHRAGMITKAEVRAIAHHLGLPVWDMPAMACLSSRVPHGTAITPELLRQIEEAEDVLVELGFAQFRVRHHNELARIEVPTEDFARALEHHQAIVEGIKRAGYRFVTLDLAGFRSGSLNGASAAKVIVPVSDLLAV